MNSPNTYQGQYAAGDSVVGFLNRVYLWMMGGLGISALSAYYIVSHPYLFQAIMSSGMFTALLIAQFIAVIAFSVLARKQNPTLNTVLYLAYTILSGVTLSVVAMAYTSSSIVLAFIATAVGFFGLSIFGRVTNRDLTGMGRFCIMGLFGMIGVMLLSFFIPSLHSSTMQLTLAVVGVIVFSGLTAYDTQKIKKMYMYQMQSGGSASATQALAISGALTLYLDFINLFLMLLRLGGSRR
jgi:FtsH-binding integral membrane protein